MTERLNELQRLSATLDAKVTIVMEGGVTSVKFKAPGQRAEVVTDDARVTGYPASTPETLIDALLTRLGWAGVPLRTNDEFMRLVRKRPAKLALLQSLLDQIRELKREVLTPIEEIEPRLASPRSSLNPQFMEGSER